jgi:predicted dehydrogenase
MKKTKVGIIGCGNISGAYLSAGRKFEILDIVALADVLPERARAKAEEFGIARACTVDELLGDADIEIVINLTIPAAHTEVALQVIAAGKSVHGEKPLAITREDGQRILAAAQAKGVRVGNAPDTFLGAGIQTCRKLIDDGWIGKPIAATAFMACHGHEGWHPDPGFYYKVGGGPMFDMGPYYLTALINLMGPVRRVTGSTQTTFAERTITSQPLYGTKVTVDVPTHVAGLLEFTGGAIGTIITSFDVWASQLPCIEIYGTEGTLSVPDPNNFGGPVRLRRAGADTWSEIPLSHSYADNFRSIGVADMAYGLQYHRPHRASGELAYHVLDIMHAIHDSARDGQHITLASTCARPAALPVGLREGLLDEG